jgi:uncharacterized protein (DUF1330 family)
MKTHVKLGLALLAGFGLGAGAVHELHAQAASPAYVISEVDVIDEDGYAHQFLPAVNEALAASGQKRLAAGGNTLSIAGDPPKSRIVLSVFENMEKAQAAYTSQAFQDAEKIGEKYAKIRIFAVEGATP